MSITVWRYIYFGFLLMYMALMISLTLGYTVVRPRVLLMACQTMYGYTRRSHKKFCWIKIFFPCWRECRNIFYIFLAYGFHGGWSKAIITWMLIWFDQRHYVDSYGPCSGTSLKLVVVHWRQIILAFINNYYIFSTRYVITFSS